MTFDDGTYVVDRNDVVWLVVHDGGMATRADYGGVHSAGIVWLEKNAGPLRPLNLHPKETA